MSNTQQKNRPALRFPEFEGDLEHTKMNKVVSSNIYGPRFNANDYSDIGNVKTIRGTDISESGEIIYQQVPLAQLDEKIVSAHKLIDGDLVMITTADCGLTGVFRKQKINYLASAYAVRIRLNEKGYPDYFKYFFQTKKAKNEISKFVRKATVANLPGSDILRITINLPSKPEQQKIADFLCAVDKRIQQLTRKKELLEQYKKGVMQQLFSQQIRFKDDNGNNYPNWEEKRLGEVANITTGKSNRVDSSADKGQYTFFDRSQDIRTSSIFLFDTEAIIVGGEGQEFIPKYYKGKFDLHQRAYAIMDYKNAKGKYLYYFIYCNRRHFFSQAVGSTVKSLRLPMFENMPTMLPCIEEQQKIADYLSSVDDKITLVNIELEQSKEFKKGLLQQMFV